MRSWYGFSFEEFWDWGNRCAGYSGIECLVTYWGFLRLIKLQCYQTITCYLSIYTSPLIPSIQLFSPTYLCNITTAVWLTPWISPHPICLGSVSDWTPDNSRPWPLFAPLFILSSHHHHLRSKYQVLVNQDIMFFNNSIIAYSPNWQWCRLTDRRTTFEKKQFLGRSRVSVSRERCSLSFMNYLSSRCRVGHGETWLSCTEIWRRRGKRGRQKKEIIEEKETRVKAESPQYRRRPLFRFVSMVHSPHTPREKTIINWAS